MDVIPNSLENVISDLKANGYLEGVPHEMSLDVGSLFDPRNESRLVYGYARVSTYRQEHLNQSIPQQCRRLKNYYDNFLAEQGFVWAGIEQDTESATKKGFFDRNGGSKIVNRIRKGDILLVDKPDRLWRNTKDFISTLGVLKDIGVTVHFVNFLGATLEMGTPMGDFTLQLLVMVAELESRMKGERVGAAEAARQQEGFFTRFNPPLGTKLIGKHRKDGGSGCKLVWNWGWRYFVQRAIRLVDECGYGIMDAAWKIEEEIAGKAGRKFRRSAFQPTVVFNLTSVNKAIKRERFYQENFITDPNLTWCAPGNEQWYAEQLMKCRNDALAKIESGKPVHTAPPGELEKFERKIAKDPKFSVIRKRT